MQPAQFDRVVKVTIGTLKNSVLNAAVIASNPLKITFDITKTAFSLANLGVILADLVDMGMVVPDWSWLSCCCC